MENYRFHLEKYHPGNKTTCPRCGHKACFVRYVDDQNTVAFPGHVGRCDHEQSCGYHYTSKDYFRGHPNVAEMLSGEPKPVIPPTLSMPEVTPPSFIDKSVMEQTLCRYDINPLYTYLVGTIGREHTERLFRLYNVGTSMKWQGATVFWQVDADGKVRGGKVMGYDSKTGHRIKLPHPHVCWVHSELGLADYHLSQCFFGKHLLPLYPGKTVLVVESEKTAIIAAHFMPDVIWIATGGKNGCFNERTAQALAGREVILMPDLGATDEWRKKLPMLTKICRSVSVSDLLEEMATDEQRSQGLDIADFLLMEDTAQMILQKMINRNPCLQTLIDTFGLVLVED